MALAQSIKGYSRVGYNRLRFMFLTGFSKSLGWVYARKKFKTGLLYIFILSVCFNYDN